tara:strand:+ start:1249 stop:2181 length:933 start_codon:yes stop_codon:yes gene_type:complete
MNKKVQILLATYNGEIYLPEQIESLLGQDYGNFEILIRDDGSQDRTQVILNDYAERYPEIITIIPSTFSTGSAKSNFRELMHECDADYIFWADHDDIWDTKKLRAMLSEMERLEDGDTSNPVFVFSDAQVIDADGNTIFESYFAMKKVDPAVGYRLSNSLICTSSLGCASSINRAMLEYCKDVPEGVTGHDWYAHILALVFGRVSVLREPLIKYRVHGSNSSNPSEVSIANYANRGGKAAFVRRGVRLRIQQAECIATQYGEQMSADNLKVFQTFLSIRHSGFLSKRYILVRNRFLYSDFLRNVATFLFV